MIPAVRELIKRLLRLSKHSVHEKVRGMGRTVEPLTIGLQNGCSREDTMIRTQLKRTRGQRWQHSGLLLKRISLLLCCLPVCPLPTTHGIDPSSNDILARVADGVVKQRAAAYSVVREYRLRNFRFDKEATVTVQVSYRPDVGTQYTVLDRSGSTRLTEIIEKLLDSEADTSRPAKLSQYELSPINYQACLRGTEIVSGRACYVIDLVPKHKSKYLIRGTAWVDRNNFAVARLEGVTAASVSMWIGAPHIQVEFGEIHGIWLPTHTGAVSSGLFLGTSELEIEYMDYLITNSD